MNKFVITGRLSKKPELNNGKVFLNIGSDKSVKNGDSWERGTAWNTVTVFGKRAETCANYLVKGQHVTVEGTIETVKKDESYNTYLTAKEVEFGAKPAGSSNNQVVDDGVMDDLPF